MLYRTAGQFKTSYRADHALFPVRQDAWLLGAILVVAFVVFPATASEFTFRALLIPVLIYSLAALGLNILTGYAGQLSLGTGAFMGVGAYACYKLITLFPDLNLIVAIALSGFFSAAVGVAFGLPSLRIKGFYLAITTLAAQFFLVWLFEKWAWLYNYSSSGAIQVHNINMFGVTVAGPNATAVTQYYFVLAVVSVVTMLAINVTRGRIGRIWKSVRDMDIAAELVGINLMKAKLSAFAVSSYIVGDRRRAVRVPVARRGRAQFVRHPAVLPGAVHRHHRRAGVDPRQFPRRDADRRAAGDDRQRARHGRPVGQLVDGRASERHDDRGADHPVPDHRAAGAGALLGDHPREADPVAVPALNERSTK